MKTIHYYFDFLSPFSYFSWKKVQELKRDYNIVYKPIVLGKVLNHWEIKGPGLVPPKRDYLFKFCLRYAKLNSIDFQSPLKVPFNSLYCLRLALESKNQEKIIESLWRYIWVLRGDPEDPDQITSFLQKEGLPSDLIEKSFEREKKVLLKNNTKEAIEEGIFGVPSFRIEKEVFWGLDAIGHLKLFLNKEYPLKSQEFTVFNNSLL